MIEELLTSLDYAYTVKCLQDMIKIKSIVGDEAELAYYLKEELEAIGLTCHVHMVESNRPNIYARLEGNPQKGVQFMFQGHTDTVAICEGWETDPLQPVIKENCLYGLGSNDMKAGLACILTTLKAFADSSIDFTGNLLFSGVIDEEAYSKGARAMLKTEFRKCNAILIAEPYPGDRSKPIPLGLTGKVLYDVKVKGRAAHGFTPKLGVNAIEEAAKIIVNLGMLKRRAHPQFGQGTLCPLRIEGGYRIYSVVVPDCCRFEVNRLLVPGESPQSAVEELEDLVRSLRLNAKVEVKVKPPYYEPFVLEKEEPLLKIFHEVYKLVKEVEPVYEYASYITDANIYAGEAGIPCLHLGPKAGNTHQPNEYVELEWLPIVSKMFSLVATRFLGIEFNGCSQ